MPNNIIVDPMRHVDLFEIVDFKQSELFKNTNLKANSMVVDIEHRYLLGCEFLGLRIVGISSSIEVFYYKI